LALASSRFLLFAHATPKAAEEYLSNSAEKEL
jgi:hypothetical protein